MRALLIITILLSNIHIYAQGCDSIPAINEKIVELALGKVGKKVGRGECWDLAKYALDEVNAEWDHFEKYGRKYNEKKECIMPGDIIQFEKVVIKYDDGGTTFTEKMFHHTAIVVEVRENNELLIAHQNTAKYGRKVGTTTMNPDNVVKGDLLFYRPVEGG